LADALPRCLLPELIRIAAEYAVVLTAQFDERCLDVPHTSETGAHRLIPGAAAWDGKVPAAAIATVDLVHSERFVWIVGKETFGECGLSRWSVRIDANPGEMSVGFGLSALTVESARHLSGRQHRQRRR
jgi:hypothetical protein